MSETCIRHPEAAAIDRCKSCERPVCRTCASFLPGGPFCSAKCSDAYIEMQGSAARREAAIPLPAALPPPPPPPPRPAQDPGSSHRQAQVKPPPPTRRGPARRTEDNLGVKILVGVLGAVVLLLGVLVLAQESPPSSDASTSSTKSPAPPPAPPPAVEPRPVPPPPPRKIDPPAPRPEPRPEPPKPEPKPEPAKPVPKPEPPRIEPPPPTPKVEPKPEPKPEPPVPPPKPDPRIVDPWAQEKPGTWFRRHRRTPAGDVYTDIGLVSREAGSLTLVSQTFDKVRGQEQVSAESAVTTLTGTEKLAVKNLSFDCALYETRRGDELTRRWIIREGDYAGLTLKEQRGQETRQVTGLHPASVLKVGDRSYSCLVVDETSSAGGKPCRVWYCPDAPLGVLQRQDEGGLETVVDRGGDWGARFFPPELRREEAARAVAEARKKIREITPLFIETQNASAKLPADPAELRDLWQKAQRVQKVIEEALALYRKAKPDAADPAQVTQWEEKLGELLQDAKNTVQQVGGRFK